jgi:hypothetical protein
MVLAGSLHTTQPKLPYHWIGTAMFASLSPRTIAKPVHTLPWSQLDFVVANRFQTPVPLEQTGLWQL